MDVDQFIRELPINTLVPTHDMRLVQELFPRTIVMDEGRDMAAGADVRINYASLDSGPVVMQGTGRVKIISAVGNIRAVNGVTQNFAKLMGLPAGQWSTTYLLSVYNNITFSE